jgi:alpha-1,3-mannosyl-glycoprotein beta-1,2-N-acetylglucosaminyltransferase
VGGARSSRSSSQKRVVSRRALAALAGGAVLVGCACAWVFLGVPVLLRWGRRSAELQTAHRGDDAGIVFSGRDVSTAEGSLGAVLTTPPRPYDGAVALRGRAGTNGNKIHHSNAAAAAATPPPTHLPPNIIPSNHPQDAPKPPPPPPPPPPTPPATLPAAADAAAADAADADAADAPPAAPPTLPSGKTAVVVICFSRPNYLKKTLSYVLERYHAGIDVFVSQDGAKPGVAQAVTEFAAKARARLGITVTHLRHPPQGGNNGYEKLAIHFGWALRELFDERQYQRVIILEDDMEIAPDFFSYFLRTAPLLDADDSLMAVSAFNDNGFKGFVSDPKRVVRSDYFPGLGWMLNRRLWSEWGPKWPKGYWDDWLREPPQRRGRAVLRPEICRTFTFGRRGVSTGQFYDKFLGRIALNRVNVNWAHEDLSYLGKTLFDAEWRDTISAARAVSLDEAAKGMRVGVGGLGISGDIKVVYRSLERGPNPSFMSVAKRLNIMDSIKAKVPRCAYLGALSLRLPGAANGQRLFVVQAPTGFVGK